MVHWYISRVKDAIMSDPCNANLVHIDNCLAVYLSGPMTILGFQGRAIPHDYSFAESRDAVMQLARENGCTTLAFDLEGMDFAPRGLVGLLLSLRAAGIQIELHDCGEEIRSVLAITHVDELLSVIEARPELETTC